MVNGLVKVEAVIERPPPPPWVGDLPVEEATSWWPGTLLDWRWVDKPEGTWTALVQYRREGLTYLHWVSGELLDVEPEEGDSGALGTRALGSEGTRGWPERTSQQDMARHGDRSPVWALGGPLRSPTKESP